MTTMEKNVITTSSNTQNLNYNVLLTPSLNTKPIITQQRIINPESIKEPTSIQTFHTVHIPTNNRKNVVVRRSRRVESDDAIKYKCCVSVCIWMFALPLIICDLYFGFTDTSCVRKEPKDMGISMRIYLLVSGFVAIGTIALGNFCMCISYDLKEYRTLTFLWINFVTIFSFGWNIVGAVIFWRSIYDENICDKNVSTYIFVSLILKLLGNVWGLCMEKKSST